MKTNIILAGDIHINIIEGNTDKHSDQYLDTLASHSLLPGHRYATRKNSSLDHIFCNLNPAKVEATVAVLDTTITDHQMVLIYIYNKITSTKDHKWKTITNFTEAAKTLETLNINELLNLQDPTELCSRLINIITDCLDKHTIIKKYLHVKEL